jgi:iron complex outermembrane recepter protein
VQPPELEGTDAVLFDRYIEGGLNAIEHERPEWRGTLTSELQRAAWRGLVRASYYGRYVSSLYSYSEAGAQEYSPEWILDAELGWSLRDRIRLSVGARNLFDNFPDKMIPDNSFGMFLYPSASPFGFNGRFVYTRLEAELGGWR